jgi:hypothetical protein
MLTVSQAGVTEWQTRSTQNCASPKSYAVIVNEALRNKEFQKNVPRFTFDLLTKPSKIQLILDLLAFDAT